MNNLSLLCAFNSNRCRTKHSKDRKKIEATRLQKQFPLDLIYLHTPNILSRLRKNTAFNVNTHNTLSHEKAVKINFVAHIISPSPLKKRQKLIFKCKGNFCFWDDSSFVPFQNVGSNELLDENLQTTWWSWWYSDFRIFTGGRKARKVYNFTILRVVKVLNFLGEIKKFFWILIHFSLLWEIFQKEIIRNTYSCFLLSKLSTMRGVTFSASVHFNMHENPWQKNSNRFISTQLKLLLSIFSLNPSFEPFFYCDTHQPPLKKNRGWNMWNSSINLP